MGDRVATFLDGEPERIPQHLRKVVTHEERFVLVHRQAGVALSSVKREAQAALRHAVAADELLEFRADAEARVLEVDRVHRVVRDRHLDLVPRHDLLVVIADDTRMAAARPARVHAIEVHEAHRLVRPVGVRHAGAEAGGDEREVRIGVPGLDDALLGGEFGPAIEPVVLVVGALGEDGAERIDVGSHPGLLEQPGRDAPIEEAGRGMRRPVQALRVGRQGGAVLRGHEPVKVHHVEP